MKYHIRNYIQEYSRSRYKIKTIKKKITNLVIDQTF